MLLAGSQEEQQRLAEQQLQEEQAKKAKEAAVSRVLNVTVDVQVRPVPCWEALLHHCSFLTSSGCVLELEDREQVTCVCFFFLLSLFGDRVQLDLG